MAWRGDTTPQSNDLPHTTWHPEKRSIVIKSKGLRCIRRPRLFAITIGGLPSDGAEMTWKKLAIEPRSRRDRAVIAARSSRDRTHSAAELIPLEPTMIDGAPGSRSTHDRGPIAARSWSDRGKHWRLFDREIRSKSARN